MVDAAVSNTVDESHEGSSPSPGTKLQFAEKVCEVIEKLHRRHRPRKPTGFCLLSQYLTCEVAQSQARSDVYRDRCRDVVCAYLHGNAYKLALVFDPND